MAGSNAERKIGLVAFDHEVEIIGDGIEKPAKVTDPGMLMNYDQLKQNGEEQGEARMSRPISETKENLL